MKLLNFAILGILLLQGCAPVPFVRPVVLKESSNVRLLTRLWSLEVPREFSRRITGKNNEVIVAASHGIKLNFFATHSNNESYDPKKFLMRLVSIIFTKEGYSTIEQAGNEVITNNEKGYLYRAKIKRRNGEIGAFIALISYRGVDGAVVIIELDNHEHQPLLDAHKIAKSLKYRN